MMAPAKHLGMTARSKSILCSPMVPAASRPRAYHNLRRSPQRAASTAFTNPDDLKHIESNSTSPRQISKPTAPLAILRLPYLIRSYILALFTTTPLLLTPSLSILSTLAHSKSGLLSPDHNILLQWLLKRTFYAHFCAGENESEVRSTAHGLHMLGFQGVILAYAKEVVVEVDEGNTSIQRDIAGISIHDNISPSDLAAIKAWEENTLLTLRMASPSADFVALKLSGAGPAALHALTNNLPMPPPLHSAALSICDLARERQTAILVDAEQSALQLAVDSWTLDLQQRYNTPDNALVHSTYQTYRKAIPKTLARDLAVAAEKNFALGVKLVRGAYLAHDPRQEFWESKEGTDACFDGITEALIRRQWNEVLSPSEGIKEGLKARFPTIDLMLATHNRPSVQKALALQRKFLCQSDAAVGGNGKRNTKITYAQLLGMADEVSCELIAPPSSSPSPSLSTLPYSSSTTNKVSTLPEVKVYKYATWGTLSECLKYLLRRAQENRDAIERAREGRDALGLELVRRVKGMFGR